VNINIRKIDLNLLVALKVLLEERNVSRTAERLALTQPTVSGMLSRLRVLFDDPLFVRTQHGMLPTPRAEALTPALAELLADAAALVAPPVFDPYAMDIAVTISVNDYMLSTLVAPFIRVLRREAPQLRLAIRHLEVTELPPMLARGEIDMAITIPEFAEASLHQRPLYREEYVGVVRKNHPVASSKRVKLDDFLSYDHVVVSPSDGSFEGPTDKALHELGRERRVALSIPSFLVLSDVLESDDLIALVPRRLLERRYQHLQPIDLPLEVPGFDVIAVWHARTHFDPAHRWLRNRLAEVAAELTA